MNIFRLLFLSFVCSAQLFALIVESDQLADVRKHLVPNCLLMFDIDNTLAHPNGLIGSDEWFVHMIEQQKEQGKDFIQALNNVLPIYYEVQLKVPLQLIEQSTPQLLAELQKEGIDVIALTARSLPLVNRTIEQLSAIDIDFSHNHIGPVFVLRNAPHLYMYKRGILFSGDNNKGEALVDFLDYCDVKPEKIIFVDDKLHNLHKVEAIVEQRNISFVGIRYGRLDEHVQNFDEQVAEQELHAFHHI
jgi:FMN phosphatase YigB (HAD superfamily)